MKNRPEQGYESDTERLDRIVGNAIEALTDFVDEANDGQIVLTDDQYRNFKNALTIAKKLK